MTRENLTGLKVVRAFNAAKISGRQIRKRQRKSDENADVHHAWHGISVPGDDFCTECIISGIYWLGAKLVDDISIPLNGTMTEIFTAIGSRADMLGDVVVFNSYALYVVMAFVLLLMNFCHASKSTGICRPYQ